MSLSGRTGWVLVSDMMRTPGPLWIVDPPRRPPERDAPPVRLGPSFDGYPVGGESRWNANFELIRSISKTFGVVAFVDAGSLGRDAGDLTSAEVELADGLCLRLELPVGPVRLEYGHNLTQDRGEPSGTFHFAIGAAF